jgi:hypothetical protein
MICLLVAGLVSATLPTDQFTLRWIHSVERIGWEEDWRKTAGLMMLTEARVRGSGAGMEPGPDATLSEGWWRWRPALPLQPEIVLGRSDFVADHELCWDGTCQGLGALVNDASRGPVTVRPCPR